MIEWATANPGFATFIVVVVLCAAVSIVHALMEPLRERARTTRLRAEADLELSRNRTCDRDRSLVDGVDTTPPA